MQNGGIVVKLAAVVRSREHGDQFAVSIELIPILNNLMRATYQIYFMPLAKCRHYVLVEFVANATIVVGPSWLIPNTAYSLGAARGGLVFVGGVRPEEITK